MSVNDRTERRPDPKLLALLICPVSRGPLTYSEATGELISERARLAYPIRDGIPVMLEGEARRLDEVSSSPVDQA